MRFYDCYDNDVIMIACMGEVGVEVYKCKMKSATK